MKSRRFNVVMPEVNELWAAKVLGMQVNPEKGPDLIDGSKVVELKFRLAGEKCGAEKYHRSWRVLEYQMGYNKKIPAFWGLGLYEINRPVSRISSENTENLESIVLRRTLWIVPWDWMLQFPPSYTSGKSEYSSWENTFRYPKLKYLPRTTETHKVRKGLVHLTQGINPEYFGFLNGI